MRRSKPHITKGSAGWEVNAIPGDVIPYSQWLAAIAFQDRLNEGRVEQTAKQLGIWRGTLTDRAKAIIDHALAGPR